MFPGDAGLDQIRGLNRKGEEIVGIAIDDLHDDKDLVVLRQRTCLNLHCSLRSSQVLPLQFLKRIGQSPWIDRLREIVERIELKCLDGVFVIGSGKNYIGTAV